MPACSEPHLQAEARDDRFRLDGRDFGVVFRRMGDRWNERIEWPRRDVELIRSMDVPTEAADPARVVHPVYQEVHLHGPASGNTLCVLLTGLSDAHHFSAAVTLAPAPEIESGWLLDFDIADRCRAPVEQFAATYQVDLGSGALESAEIGRISWWLEEPLRGRLEILAGLGGSISMAEAGRKATRVQVAAAIRPGTFTHRLRYGWRWTRVEGGTR